VLKKKQAPEQSKEPVEPLKKKNTRRKSKLGDVEAVTDKGDGKKRNKVEAEKTNDITDLGAKDTSGVFLVNEDISGDESKVKKRRT